MTKDEALDLALEALELSAVTVDSFGVQKKTKEAITAIKQARSAPVQEPRWYCIDKTGMATLCADEDDAKQSVKLAEQDWPRNAPYRAVQLCEYTTPPAQPTPVAWMDASGDIYKHELWPDWNPPHTPLYTTPPAVPVHEPEIVQRVKRYAGQTLRTARNPNITARECIELANWFAANTSPPAAQRQWVDMPELELLGAYEEEQRGRFGDHVRGLLNVQAKLKKKNA